jgi:ATP-dependent Clp protease ATP-binding subunit ClpB
MINKELLDKEAKEVLEIAINIALEDNNSIVDTDHLLLALISKDDSPLLKIFEKKNINKKALKENIMSYLNDIYSQINKAIEDYSSYLKNLRHQLIQAKNQANEIYEELDAVENYYKEKINEKSSQNKGFFSKILSSEYEIESELQRLTIYENQLKSNLNSLKSQLSQLTDIDTADKFLSGDIDLPSFLYKIVENSSFIKQIDDIGFSKDRVTEKTIENVTGSRKIKIYSSKLTKVLEEAKEIASKSSQHNKIDVIHLTIALLDNKDTIACKILSEIAPRIEIICMLYNNDQQKSNENKKNTPPPPHKK